MGGEARARRGRRGACTGGLDLHFKGKPWHFVKNDRGLRVEDDHKRWKVSKVVDRLASEPSRLPFMADGKPAAALERERDATRCGL